MTHAPTIEQDLLEAREVLNRTVSADACEVASDVAAVIIDCYQSGGKVLIAGNGGSAADAQHFAGEMMGWFLDPDRKPLRTIALTTDTSVLTAIVNDAGYQFTFARQVRGLTDPKDVFIGITTSGTSGNILTALRTAREMKATTVALCGENPKGLPLIADYVISVPSDRTPHIQIAHAAILHAICKVVDETMGKVA